MAERGRIVGSVAELIGQTPVVRLRRFDALDHDDDPESRRATIWAKCEQLEPAGSVKDRIALAIIDAAERDGRLRPNGVVVEATSGNTGVALALICKLRGHRCVLTMPASMSLERRQLLKAYGAELVLTDPERQMEGAVERASQIVAETPGAFWVRQFDAPENPRVHEEQTARELRDALGARGVGRVAALVSAVGTGGTITGLARALAVGDGALVARVVAVEPAASATLSRGERGPSKIQGIGAGFVPANYEAHRVDAIATVTDERAFETARSLATREGLLVGPSAGAAVAIALDEARAAGKGAHVVTILCDTGERYFSLERAAAAGASVS